MRVRVLIVARLVLNSRTFVGTWWDLNEGQWEVGNRQWGRMGLVRGGRRGGLRCEEIVPPCAPRGGGMPSSA